MISLCVCIVYTGLEAFCRAHVCQPKSFQLSFVVASALWSVCVTLKYENFFVWWRQRRRRRTRTLVENYEIEYMYFSWCIKFICHPMWYWINKKTTFHPVEVYISSKTFGILIVATFRRGTHTVSTTTTTMATMNNYFNMRKKETIVIWCWCCSRNYTICVWWVAHISRSTLNVNGTTSWRTSRSIILHARPNCKAFIFNFHLQCQLLVLG